MREPWYASNTQGISFLVIEPERMRDAFPVVIRNKQKYTVSVGSGKETGFDPKESHVSLSANTISGHHCKLHFSKDKGHTKVEIEDENSLNGTFVIKRPSINSSRRPFLEREVRGEKFDLKGIEFIRLGPCCVIALEATTIYWEDDTGETDPPEKESETKTDEVGKFLEQGWYYPLPVKAPTSEK